MCPKTTVKAAVLILIFSLFFSLFACGELSTPLFSSGGTYPARALVNGSSLESCSLIRQNDKIIPYFAVSVVNDPDLMGLLVYLQNSRGEIVGEKVLYTIHPVDDVIQPETQQEETKPEVDATENFRDKESSDVSSEASDDSSSWGNDSAAESTVETETGSTKQGTEKRVSASSGKKYDTVILIKSFQQEMPSFPLPKNLEVGPYSLVFEAVGRTNTLSLTESDIFYLGSLEFRLNDISMYLPGLSDTRLIPPSTTVMLEAGLDFDSSLNPYVIWYNGRNIISEGNISDGAGSILWKAPEQSGFYSLRLEVLPYRLKRNFTGIFREITLPVSAKASQTSYFFENGPDYPAKKPLLAAELAITPVPPEYPELLRWYRFDGSLDETSLIPDRMFEPAKEKASRWAAVGKSYGLSAGPDDIYLLRPIRFLRQDQDQGGGIFLFHIRPVTEGTVFSVFFPALAEASALASASDGVWMDMTARENAITLRLKTKTASVEMPVNTRNSEEQELLPIVIEFYIRPYRFEAKLSLGEDLSPQSKTGNIRLPGALSGEGRIKLGVDKTAPEAETDPLRANPTAKDTSAKTVQPESINNENKTSTAPVPVTALTTIWDEFAVLYSTTPLLPEEIVEDTDSEKTEGPQEEETPIKTPATAPSTAVETRPERPTPNSAVPGPVNVNPSDTSIENDAPTAEAQTVNILIEQESAETEDEEVLSLIPLS